MALWLVRAGSHGEHETKYLNEGYIYLTWGGFNYDLSKCRTRDDVKALIVDIYENPKQGKINNHASQIWAFSHRIDIGDWVVLPSKYKAAIHIGEVTGDYEFLPNADNPFFHRKKVEWFATDIPRSNFDQDILYSLGAFMTVCQIRRNNAEERIKAMSKNGWKPAAVSVAKSPKQSQDGEASDDEQDAATDLVTVARDQIAKLILAKFKGHGMARLVNAILEAQGYTTHLSPEGTDKGIDILAAPGPMGFGRPRLCVQVKSGDSALDRPTLDQLIGAMQNVQAEHGLLVSWGGFKTTVDREEATQFFRVRLWDQDDLIEALLDNYGNIDDSIRAELPLKRIWTVAGTDDDA